ncbi:MAG: hypothetical protein GWM90_20135, partial [Gemmatimonadetes bacterium]|nr:hypothetical protein [Gemmatimonadota bacterium]NIQ56761.1 hypothetical protein [Gemmatimonadota bacterium]NIU76942.1 hypothetical protein [Gammaproteobacteria bacterium]NIX46309.1 hypothetical protein [Gemmatimonadota bacterium]NIY10636.1 hypothetical protein [Gemmatimonadota bacterium]
MPDSDYGRRLPLAAQVLFGALLAGTALYVVPTLVLSGAIVTAVVAAVVWLGGTGALWYLYRRDLRWAARRLADERDAHRLYRTLIEHGAEAHVVVRSDGAVAYASPNLTALLGVDPDGLDERGGLIDLVRHADRRRALEAFARVRRS